MTDVTSTALKILEFLRSPSRAHVVIWLVSGSLLFAPDEVLEMVRGRAMRDDAAIYLSIVFLLLTVLFALVGTEWIWKTASQRFAEKRARNRLRARLRGLTFEEKGILREFVTEGADTVDLPREWEPAWRLKGEGIFREVGSGYLTYHSQGREIRGTLYELLPEAREFLDGHPELLAHGEEDAEPSSP